MLKSRLIIFSIFLSSLFGAKYLAVIALEPESISKSEARILTQRLTSKMIELSEYTVVERASIDKILKEQKFQHSGCTDSECAVEIGQLLNADLTIIGTASKFGRTYTIDCRIINVESGEALQSASFTHTGEIDELIKDGIESIAHKLLGIPYQKKIQSSTTTSTYGATLNIQSSPAGAKVFIGGNYFETTPLILTDFPAGEYEVLLKLEGHDDYITSVQLLPRGYKDISAALKGIPSWITFAGSNPKPSEVSIEINGNKQNIDSRFKVKIGAGNHEIKVSKENYVEYLDTISVAVGQTVRIKYDLKKNMGYLKLSMEPSKATVYVDGSTTLNHAELVPGIHFLRVSHPGHDDYSGEVEIKLDETIELNIELIKQYGYLDLKLKPYNAKVYFNDSLAMVLEPPSAIVFDNHITEFKLTPGSYEIRAKKPFYHAKTLTAKIQNQERTALTLTLDSKNRETAKKRALMFPGLGHMYADSPSKGFFFMAIEVASIAGTAMMASDYMNISNDWDLAKADYLAETDPNEIQRKFTIYESFDKNKTEKLMGSVGLGSAAIAVWIWNVYDLNKSLPSVFDLGMNANGQLELSVAF